ncbi:phage head-tail connector protein [Limosilactobacillus sp.]|jgi:hypothetical protein|uniref:phage head-tail connector protein n=1 Tax=Limosilactobacillus sp. TaxID=2773925 RepID=UPI0025C073CF|nr:phage head-tail connector protein [Limosilactobacillus sp.]MCH3922380.1 phage head-tail connector protein [Limosilactobacillus sp.]MCH3929152.1 phage head-tail connector protein [Limosilactobacillus sp.]
MADNQTVTRIQTLLGVELDDTEKARVQIYVEDAKQAIMTYVASYADDPSIFPDELGYIVDQMALAKFNKFHNEGMTSVSEEGLTLSFSSNDLKDYLPDLQAWIDRKTGADDSMTGRAIGW